MNNLMTRRGSGLLDQIFSIPVDDGRDCGYLIYAPLKGIAFIANPALVNLIFDACEHGGVADLMAKADYSALDFLYALNFFDPEPLPEEDAADSRVCLDTVVLFLSNRCNLQCTYCYASANQHASRHMPFDLARASIDHVMKNHPGPRPDTLTLAFHGGGEPTLNPAVMTEAASYARDLCEKQGTELRMSGSSNGVWSDETRRFILNHFNEISISFDGLPEIQNRQRPTASGGPSFPMVEKTLTRLDRAGFDYGIRMTVTADSLDKMAESVSFICDNFDAGKIQVEPVFPEGRALDNRSMITAPDRFVEQFKQSHGIARDHHVRLFYSGARPETLTNRFCLSAGRAFVVTPDGDVTTCFEIHSRSHPKSKRFIIGSYDGNGGFSFHRNRNLVFLQQHQDNIPHCRQCFCKWHCAGDCSAKTGPGRDDREDRFTPTDRCYLTREITRYLLGRKIIRAGGLICTDTWED